jgi:signal transduction histidine kinase
MIGELHDARESVVFDSMVPIEDLVERDGLRELCQSFQGLFGIGVRLYSVDGTLLAAAATDQELCVEIGGSAVGHRACAATIAGVVAHDPGVAFEVVIPCFTGAEYYVAAIEYDGRRIGRLIVGPYVPVHTTTVPATLSDAVPGFEPERASALMAKMPHAKPETIRRIGGHLKAALDLILFSGHKAHMTSKMHLASVRESYRELADKNERLQEAFDRLKELDRLKSQFLATVSHELRTPLTSIIGYSEMLVQGLVGEMQPDQVEFVRTIHDKGEQLVKLIMGLLDLGKLESGTMRVMIRPTRLEPILAEVVSTMKPAATKKGVRLEFGPGDTSALPELQGDSERLRQVFLNLVENAIKFTPSGGEVTLRAQVAPIDDAENGDGQEDGLSVLAPTLLPIEVRVADTGIGIPAAERQRVFDAFYQVDSSSTREHGGTGLGLAIVKRLVDAHAGTVRIEDGQPRGTVFVVSLPQAGSNVHG